MIDSLYLEEPKPCSSFRYVCRLCKESFQHHQTMKSHLTKMHGDSTDKNYTVLTIADKASAITPEFWAKRCVPFLHESMSSRKKSLNWCKLVSLKSLLVSRNTWCSLFHQSAPFFKLHFKWSSNAPKKKTFETAE